MLARQHLATIQIDDYETFLLEFLCLQGHFIFDVLFVRMLLTNKSDEWLCIVLKSAKAWAYFQVSRTSL